MIMGSTFALPGTDRSLRAHARGIGHGAFTDFESFERHSGSEFGMICSHGAEVALPEEQRLAKSRCQIIEETGGGIDITRDHGCAGIFQWNGRARPD
jgi:hypothetical protein